MGWIERLETIPSLYRWVMVPVLLLLVGDTYWNVVHQPRAEELAALQARNASETQQLRRQRTIAAQVEGLEDAVAALRAELTRHRQFLPRQQDPPTLIRRIAGLGARTGLRIDLLWPQSERRSELYAEMPISMELQGPYHAVGLFLDRLAAWPGLIQVNRLDMRAMGANDPMPGDHVSLSWRRRSRRGACVGGSRLRLRSTGAARPHGTPRQRGAPAGGPQARGARAQWSARLPKHASRWNVSTWRI